MTILMLLVGCAPGGNYLDDELKCGANPYAWWNDLSMYVDFGEPKSNDKPNVMVWDFQYEPGYVNSIKGQYNGGNGDLEYKIKYTGDYFLDTEETVDTFDNYGTVFRNGNLDTRAMVAVTDVLGNTELFVRRDERKGCQGSTKYRWVTDEGELPRSPQYTRNYELKSDTKVEWNAQSEYADGTVLYESGSWNAQHVHETASSYDSSAWSAETATKKKANGSSQSYWTQVNKGDGLTYEGSTETKKSGAWIEDYTVTEDGAGAPYATVHTERNYDGSGTGTWTFDDGTTCTLTYTADDSCTYVCSDGGDGTC